MVLLVRAACEQFGYLRCISSLREGKVPCWDYISKTWAGIKLRAVCVIPWLLVMVIGV